MDIYLKKTKHGYEIAVVGESENTARYAGIDVKKVIIRTMLIERISLFFIPLITSRHLFELIPTLPFVAPEDTVAAVTDSLILCIDFILSLAIFI